MPKMPDRSFPSVAATAIVVAAACLVLVAGCVPPSTDPGTPAPTGTGLTASIEPGESAPVGPVGPTPIPSFVRPTPLPAPTFLAYTVKSRDTLTSIAREFHTTPRSIAFWSRDEHPSLDPESPAYQPDHLEVGWILRLIPDDVFDEDELLDAPTSPSPAASASAAASPTPGGSAG